ncbi:uncharacterized protein LOC115881640 [Sitophilus oryzae]|uniref:Uncharacterized protein LOC115881640 n=1 Tax=Sitophilus oryzae TaxID=7048 RepID=A0A6J2XU62_SITOR|nr:uncharacterized protein LOC115881640 [Sitophilus oryzae]XP_030755064.1 uncharacterized protein LOC115881640 [Sitophilus oryzae]
MSSAVKLSPSPRHARKHKQKESTDNMKQEIVAQVHKQIKSATSSSDNDYANSEDNLDISKSDKNENYNVVHTPSREISVDGECQINTKILALIETEMKRDINKHNHFTESRPQSLSFYEDEKIPEELSGNLELLSPEEKKHYRRRKEYSQMDTDERNAYNALQDIYNSRDNEEILNNSNKKSKSRKKRHGEPEAGMGDSREMMIPKERKKSKKKRREVSPGSAGNTSKRKHKTRNREDDHQPKSDVTLALEELQDDVFENAIDDFGNKTEKMRKSPRRSDKIYVQKKSRFEETSKHNNIPLSRQTAQDLDSISNLDRGFPSRHPIQVAICFQKWWLRFSTLCHGLLGGLGLGHWLYIICNFQSQDHAFLVHYAYYSDIYVGLFFGLCVLCLVSVFDRMDLAHISSTDINEFCKHKKCSFVLIAYLACLIVHLSTATYDEKLSLLAYRNHTIIGNVGGNHTALVEEEDVPESQITFIELKTWNHLSLWRALLAFTAWIVLGLGPPEDSLYNHLKNMEQYLPDK